MKDFDCGDEDLNDFFQSDALDHKKQLLAETYYFQPRQATEEETYFPVAFISFLNDSITITKEEKKSTKKDFWKKLIKTLPNPKRRYESYPALK